MKMSFIAAHNTSRPVEDEVCYSSNCSQPIMDVNVQVGVCYPSACSPDEFASVLKTIDAISVTTHTHTIQLASTGDSPMFCPQTDIEYDAGTKIMFGIRRLYIHCRTRCNGNWYGLYLVVVYHLIIKLVNLTINKLILNQGLESFSHSFL